MKDIGIAKLLIMQYLSDSCLWFADARLLKVCRQQMQLCHHFQVYQVNIYQVIVGN